jgi:large subunit ribosomal protein L23
MGMTRDAHDIILRPILTEKLTELRETQRKIGILVRRDANKVEIKKAAERALKVKIVKVNVLNGMGKARRIGRLTGKKPDWKKAIVTMKAGEKLEMFEGV